MSPSKKKTVPAAEFKARCLALIDEVARTGRPVVVSKHGKPVAQLAPLADARPKSLRGSIVHQEDLVSPVDQAWDAER